MASGNASDEQEHSSLSGIQQEATQSSDEEEETQMSSEEEEEEELEVEVEEDSDEEEEGQDDASRRALALSLYQRLFGRIRAEEPVMPFAKLCDIQPVSLRSQLAVELNRATSATIKRPLTVWPQLELSEDAAMHTRHDADLGRSIRQRLSRQRMAASCAAASCAAAAGDQSSQPSTPPATRIRLRTSQSGRASSAHTRAMARAAITAAKTTAATASAVSGTEHGDSDSDSDVQHSACLSADGRSPGSPRQAHATTRAGGSSSSQQQQQHVSSEALSSYCCGHSVVNATALLMRREVSAVRGGRTVDGWSLPELRHVQSHHKLPRYPCAVVDRLPARAYIGQFSGDGRFFVAAFQDKRVRLYDVEQGWRLRKDVTANRIRWTITDTCLSPDNRFLLYASITPTVNLVEVGSMHDVVRSEANVTQVHEMLDFSGAGEEDSNSYQGFGIWSVRWSGDGREIIAGTNNESVYVYDVQTQKVLSRVRGHTEDVNAVTYADDSPNMIVTGSDDTYIKVWDRRLLACGDTSAPGASRRSAPRAKPVGVLVGHTEGLTHLCPKGDGRYLISNCKDQTIKLWDLRAMAEGGSVRDHAQASKLSTDGIPEFNWDYRWQSYPGTGRDVRHPHDASVMTYRGHHVTHTLIRAYFSPAHTTGQRLIYTGGADGAIHVFDVVTGQEVEGSPFMQHRMLVRDCSWHPIEPMLASVSWDGTVVRWDAAPRPEGPNSELTTPGADALEDYY